MKKKLSLIVVVGCLLILVNVGIAAMLAFELESEKSEEQRKNSILTSYADAGGPYSGSIHQPVTFDGSGTHVNPGGTYEWDFDDINDKTPGYGSHPTHVYTESGKYFVTLTVTQSNGDVYKDITIVYIDQPHSHLTAYAGCFYSADRNETILFDGSQSSSDDPDVPITEWLWDFGDGSPRASGKQVTHRYNKTGVYLVTLTVKDSNGNARYDVLHADIGCQYTSNEDFFLMFDDSVSEILDIFLNKMNWDVALFSSYFNAKIYTNYDGYEKWTDLTGLKPLPKYINVRSDSDTDPDIKIDDLQFFDWQNPIGESMFHEGVIGFQWKTRLSKIEKISDNIKPEKNFTVCLQLELRPKIAEFLQLDEPLIRVGYFSPAGEEMPNQVSLSYIIRPFFRHRLLGGFSNQNQPVEEIPTQQKNMVDIWVNDQTPSDILQDEKATTGIQSDTTNTKGVPSFEFTAASKDMISGTATSHILETRSVESETVLSTYTEASLKPTSTMDDSLQEQQSDQDKPMRSPVVSETSEDLLTETHTNVIQNPSKNGFSDDTVYPEYGLEIQSTDGGNFSLMAQFLSGSSRSTTLKITYGSPKSTMMYMVAKKSGIFHRAVAFDIPGQSSVLSVLHRDSSQVTELSAGLSFHSTFDRRIGWSDDGVYISVYKGGEVGIHDFYFNNPSWTLTLDHITLGASRNLDVFLSKQEVGLRGNAGFNLSNLFFESKTTGFTAAIVGTLALDLDNTVGLALSPGSIKANFTGSLTLDLDCEFQINDASVRVGGDFELVGTYGEIEFTWGDGVFTIDVDKGPSLAISELFFEVGALCVTADSINLGNNGTFNAEWDSVHKIITIRGGTGAYLNMENVDINFSGFDMSVIGSLEIGASGYIRLSENQFGAGFTGELHLDCIIVMEDIQTTVGGDFSFVGEQGELHIIWTESEFSVDVESGPELTVSDLLFEIGNLSVTGDYIGVGASGQISLDWNIDESSIAISGGSGAYLIINNLTVTYGDPVVFNVRVLGELEIQSDGSIYLAPGVFEAEFTGMLHLGVGCEFQINGESIQVGGDFYLDSGNGRIGIVWSTDEFAVNVDNGPSLSVSNFLFEVGDLSISADVIKIGAYGSLSASWDTVNSTIRVSADTGVYFSIENVGLLYGDDFSFYTSSSLAVDAGGYVILTPTYFEAGIGGSLEFGSGFEFEINGQSVKIGGAFGISGEGVIAASWTSNLLSLDVSGGQNLTLSDLYFEKDLLRIETKSINLSVNGGILIFLNKDSKIFNINAASSFSFDDFSIAYNNEELCSLDSFGIGGGVYFDVRAGSQASVTLSYYGYANVTGLHMSPPSSWNWDLNLLSVGSANLSGTAQLFIQKSPTGKIELSGNLLSGDMKDFSVYLPVGEKGFKVGFDELTFSSNFLVSLGDTVTFSAGGSFTLSNYSSYLENIDFKIDAIEAQSTSGVTFSFTSAQLGFSLFGGQHLLVDNLSLIIGGIIDSSIPSLSVDGTGSIAVTLSDTLDVEADTDLEWEFKLKTQHFGDWEAYGNLQGSVDLRAGWADGSGSIIIEVGSSGLLHDLLILHENLTLEIGTFHLEPGTITFEWQREDYPTPGEFNILNNGVSGELTLYKINYTNPQNPIEIELGNINLVAGNIYMDWIRTVDSTKYVHITSEVSVDINLLKITKEQKIITLGGLGLKPGEFKLSWDTTVNNIIEINNGMQGLEPSISYEDLSQSLTLSVSVLSLHNDYSKTITLQWYKDQEGSISGVYLDSDGVQLATWIQFEAIKGDFGRRIKLLGLQVDGFYIKKNDGGKLEMGGKIWLVNGLVYSKQINGEWKDLEILWDIDGDGIGSIEVTTDPGFDENLQINYATVKEVNIIADFNLPHHLKVYWDVDFDLNGHVGIDTNNESIYQITFTIYKNAYGYAPRWGFYVNGLGLAAEDFQVIWDFSDPLGEWVLMKTGYLQPGSINDVWIAWNGQWYDLWNENGTPI